MKSTVSAQLMICDEEEVLKTCLLHLESLKNLTEINITDSGSQDKTHDILKEFMRNTSKRIVYTYHPFETFPKQRNFAQAQSSCDYTFRIDADETFSQEWDNVLGDIDSLCDGLVGMSVNQFNTVRDYFHRTDYCGRATTLYRTREVWFNPNYPFRQFWNGGVEVHGYHPMIRCITDTFNGVIKKHHHFLKSDKALLGKWDVQKRCGTIEAEGYENKGIPRDGWLQNKLAALDGNIVPLEKMYYDDVTNGGKNE